MDRYSVSLNQTTTIEEQKRRLAQCYALILSWPEPPKTDTADRGDFGEKTLPAVETSTQDEQSA